MFLLKHTDKAIIHQWLKKESVGFIKRFFYVCYSCIRTFQFLDRDIWQQRMMEGSEVKSSAQTKATIEDFYSAGGIPKRTNYRQRTNTIDGDSTTLDTNKSERAFKRTLNRRTSTAQEISHIMFHEVMVTSFLFPFPSSLIIYCITRN